MIEPWIMDILCDDAFRGTGLHWKVLEDGLIVRVEDQAIIANPATNQRMSYYWFSKADLTEYRTFDFNDLLKTIFE